MFGIAMLRFLTVGKKPDLLHLKMPPLCGKEYLRSNGAQSSGAASSTLYKVTRSLPDCLTEACITSFQVGNTLGLEILFAKGLPFFVRQRASCPSGSPWKSHPAKPRRHQSAIALLASGRVRSEPHLEEMSRLMRRKAEILGDFILKTSDLEGQSWVYTPKGEPSDGCKILE
jgi:hypothetical protein